MIKTQKFIIIFLFSIFYFLFSGSALAATLYLMPQSQTVYQNDSFVVDVRLNTEGEEINAVEVNLNFPSNLLEAVDLSKGNSILTFWVREPKIEKEKIIFIGGIPGGFEGEGLIGRIIFWSKEIGKAQVNFQENSRVLLNDGKGTPARLVLFEGNYEIIKKLENLPSISSRSHPDQNKWYQNRNLHLGWNLIGGAEYSYLLSGDPLARPDFIPDRPEGELLWLGDMEYRNLEDGIYYFSLIQKLPTEDWSPSITYRAMIDGTAPEEFSIEISRDPSIFGGKYFLSFATQDKMSGVDYYEVKEGKGDFKKAVSPYILEDQRLGKKITVRAFDKAGNFREAEISPAYKISWKDFILPLLILIGIGIFFGWWLWKILKTKFKLRRTGLSKLNTRC